MDSKVIAGWFSVSKNSPLWRWAWKFSSLSWIEAGSTEPVSFGVAPVVLPPLPLPTKVTVDFLPGLDWSADGPGAADDPEQVQVRYDETIRVLQAGLDALGAERPHPLLSRFGLAH